MKYSNCEEGIFRARPNRFLASVEVNGVETLCHVKNTGRCRELLLPGARVVVSRASSEKRKTEYDLIAVAKGNQLVNLDSQAPNTLAWEWIVQREADSRFGRILTAKREVAYSNSRFDLYLEAQGDSFQENSCGCSDFSPLRRVFLEVKGVTLENNGVAFFPDAPTERGVKHVRELAACTEAGYEAVLLFVVQMTMTGVSSVRPNWATHPAFGEALQEAKAKGVQILAYDCHVTESGIQLNQPLPVILDK